MLPRTVKRKTLAEAAALIQDGMRLAIGGFGLYQHPMAFLHELIRQKRRNLTIIGVTNGPDIDILAGAGCLSRVETAHVGFETLGLAPNYRRETEAGRVKVIDYPEIMAMDRFKASLENFTFWPADFLGGNDVLVHNPDIREFNCPMTGRKLWAIPPADVDVCIIHALLADELGHVYMPARRASPQSLDLAMARSCDKVIVTVEKIVPTAQLRRYPDQIELLPFNVACVVEAPYGAHPCPMTGAYIADEHFLSDWVKASADAESFQKYLEHFVLGTRDHGEYLERVGVAALMSIREVEVLA